MESAYERACVRVSECTSVLVCVEGTISDISEMRLKQAVVCKNAETTNCNVNIRHSC